MARRRLVAGVRVIHFYSATQVSEYRACARKWAYRYIAGLRVEQKESAQLGTEVDDEQIQPYLRDGRSFDFARPARKGFLQSGEIAASMLPYLPAPKTVEIQHRIELPSPTWVTVDGVRQHIGFGFQGYADIWHNDSAVIPGLQGGAPLVADTKTTSDVGQWAKTESALSVDPQAMIYATAALYEHHTNAVDLAWIYGQTKKSRKGKLVKLRVHADHVAEQFRGINATAIEMHNIGRIALLSIEAGGDPIDAVKALPPTPDACEAYGGCPYRDKCNLSPSQIIDAHSKRSEKGVSDMASTADMLAALKAKKAAQAAPAGQVTPPATVTAVAAPAPPSSPPALPAWATAPVDPMRAAHAEGKPYTAALGINPPESALPPAPPVGAAAPVEAPKRTRKAATPADTARTVRVVWGAERYQPIQYEPIDVGPFEVTTDVQPGESAADAMARGYAELVEFAEKARAEKLQSAAALRGGK